MFVTNYAGFCSAPLPFVDESLGFKAPTHPASIDKHFHPVLVFRHHEMEEMKRLMPRNVSTCSNEARRTDVVMLEPTDHTTAYHPKPAWSLKRGPKGCLY